MGGGGEGSFENGIQQLGCRVEPLRGWGAKGCREAGPCLGQEGEQEKQLFFKNSKALKQARHEALPPLAEPGAQLWHRLPAPAASPRTAPSRGLLLPEHRCAKMASADSPDSSSWHIGGAGGRMSFFHPVLLALGEHRAHPVSERCQGQWSGIRAAAGSLRSWMALLAFEGQHRPVRGHQAAPCPQPVPRFPCL